jgi:anthranilate synthase component 1
MSFDDFKRRASAATLVPVWKDILLDTDTAVSTFSKLRRGPFAFLLESAPAGGEAWSRYSYLGTEPRSAWRLANGIIEDWTADRGWHNARKSADPLADLATLVEEVQPAEVPELGQFWGGIVGYFSYDTVRLIEKLPHRPEAGLGAPDAMFVLTRSLVILDNLHGRARVVVSVPVTSALGDAELHSRYDRAIVELDDVLARLRQPARLKPISPDPARVSRGSLCA